jgi:hypothetical protein
MVLMGRETEGRRMDAGQYMAYMAVRTYLDELRDETVRPVGADRTDRSARRPRRRFGRRGAAR